MSIKKFESLVDKMVHESKFHQWGLAKNLANLFKIIYSDLFSMKEDLRILKEKKCQQCKDAKSDAADIREEEGMGA